MNKLCMFISFGLLFNSLLYAEQSIELGPCEYELYGTTTNGPNGPSDLLGLNPSDGTGTSLGTIAGAHRVIAIDFSPNGVLYGVGEDDNDVSSLLIIHCRSAKAFIIGPTNIPSNHAITDLSFDSEGVLWAYSHVGSGSPPDEIGTIDLATGAFNSVGQTGVPLTQGNAIGHDSNGDLFHAGADDLSLIDQTTGVGSYVADLKFYPPGNDRPRLTGIDLRDNGVMYGALNDKLKGPGSTPENYVVILDTNNGETSYLTNPVLNAPDKLAGLSFNPFH